MRLSSGAWSASGCRFGSSGMSASSAGSCEELSRSGSSGCGVLLPRTFVCVAVSGVT